MLAYGKIFLNLHFFKNYCSYIFQKKIKAIKQKSKEKIPYSLFSDIPSCNQLKKKNVEK